MTTPAPIGRGNVDTKHENSRGSFIHLVQTQGNKGAVSDVVEALSAFSLLF